jgi:hypothetical protein
MSDRLHELEEDISELKKLLLDAERPNVQNLLTQHISKLKTDYDNLNAVKVSELPKKTEAPPSQPKAGEKVINYQPLTKYAWDQEGSKVKYHP